MKNRFLYFIIILFLFSLVSFGQNLDSLKHVLETKNTENKINACLELSSYFFYSEPDSAEKYLNYGLELSIKKKLLKEEAIFLQQKGILANEKGNVKKAKQYFLKTIQIAEKLLDTSLIISGNGNLGNSHMYVGEYEKAIEQFTKVAKMGEEKNDIKVKATANGAIGNLYVYMKNFEKALPYYEKSRENFELLNHEIGIALSYMNIAIVLYNTEHYDEAVSNYAEASIIFKRTNNFLNSAKCISGISRVFNYKKQYKKSIETELKALAIYKDYEAEIDKMNSYSSIASNYLNLRNYNKSILYLDSAYDIALKENNFHHLLIISTKYSSCYDSLCDYKNAYRYLGLLQEYKDSIFNSESDERFTELEVKYETTQKEQEIELLKKNEELLNKENKNRQILLFGIITLFVFSILIFWLIYNRYKLKSTKKTIETEQKLLRIQMNPHFIFNALFAIESFMHKNDMNQSALYMSNFAKLMRMILESSRKNYISLEEEIEILDYYIGFQMLRFNNKFTYTIKISENIDKENTLIPPMLVQPFVENAIEHGFSNEIEKPHLNISFSLKNNYISVIIEDNGKGISDVQNKPNHQSLAVQITKERLDVIFSKKHKKNINLELLNLNKVNPVLKGTRVSFKIPYVEEF